MTVETTHPTRERLSAFGLGRLPAEEREAIEQHVRDCDSCCKALAGVHGDTLLELAREAAAQTPFAEQGDTLDAVPKELIDHPRYRILGRLGEGGMGVVFKAEHRVMGRLVALKVVNQKLTANADAVERFRREVKAAAALNHPNIVTAHDAEEAGGLHFLVMEYVEGVSLDRFVAKRGPLPAEQACHFIRQVALGLQHAHQKGMVHRDIKPHNLMVTRKGQVKILDFGLARLTADTHSRPGMTEPNLVVGTPDYLAPEQARDSHRVDIRADLYSLGCTFYFLLTGRVPFAGESPLDKLLAHTQSEVPSVAAMRADVPNDVAAIVARLMAKRPDDRFQTPGELANALTPLAKLTASGIKDDGFEVVVDSQAVTANLKRMETPAATLVEPRETPQSSRKLPRSKRKKSGRHSLTPYIAGGVGLFFAFTVIAGALIAKPWRWFGPKESPPVASGGPEKSGPPIVSPSATNKPDGTQSSTFQPSNEPRSYKRNILFVVPSNSLFFPDLSSMTRFYLGKQGVNVEIASSRIGPVGFAPNGAPPNNERVEATISLAQKIDWRRYEAVVFTGYNVDEFTRGEVGKNTFQFIRDMIDNNKVVASICTGVKVLIEGGFLDDCPEIPRTAGWEYVMAGVKRGSWRETTGIVTHGQIMMAQGPSLGADFAEQIGMKIMGKKQR